MGNDDRKTRLAALAARAGRTKAPSPSDNDKTSLGAGNHHHHNNNNNDKADDSLGTKHISFRNYAPTDKSLEQQDGPEKDHNPPPSKKRPRDDENENEKSTFVPPASSKTMLQDALREARRESTIAAVAETSSVANIAPKKINWDLKRDIQPKLAKLEKRTQRAIVDMLKKRLEMEAAQVAGDDDEDQNSDLD
jgi:coiled-coil domain-containing protein 12